MGDGIENWGVFFIGNRGSLQVNRQGYAVRPVVPHVIRKQGPPPPPTAGGVTLGAGGTAIASGAAPGAGAGGRGGPGSGGRGKPPPIDAKRYINPRGGAREDLPPAGAPRDSPHRVKARQQ